MPIRSKIRQRRQRMPAEVPYKPEEEVSATGRNGADAPANGSESASTEPSLPVSPSPELVQAIVQLMQAVEELKKDIPALKKAVQEMSQRVDMETQALLLKARISALERAVEIIPPLPPDTSDAVTIAASVVNIKAVATDLFPWLCRAGKDLPDPQAPPSQ